MNPSVDERLASIVRALNDVILPSLPDDAGLAKEQLQLAVGHIQILRAQIDAAPAYEAEELADAVRLASALVSAEGENQTSVTVSGLKQTLQDAEAAESPADVRSARINLHAKIDALVAAVFTDGDERSRSMVQDSILEQEKMRSLKDRKWFAPFGFDTFEMS